MGRAIENERDIYILKDRVKKLEDIVRGMTHELKCLCEKSTKTTHIDLVDDVKEEETNDGEKEANDKGDRGSQRSNNKSSRNNKKKSPKS